MKIVIAVLLIGSMCRAQTLKRRTEPKIVEETCPEHLDRTRRDMFDLKVKYPNRDYAQWYSVVLLSNALKPSFATCTRSHLSDLDLRMAIWQFQYVVDTGFPAPDQGR